ncbi:DNA fragmentation factor subunit beta [Microplitis mediator]|uniref:DNA fragmentation factor subunit beta n=1 Tax=Microplitis mediator TaxID=375433 RepID=UPI002554475E|nr:DNA fragmentation factor subunit beta [Microplitis mediator]XP_057332474.1 DNA fragmentation factor subunit beta [Microplitis mediator]
MSLGHCFVKITDLQVEHKLKGFKVTDANRTRKFGIACRSFQELKQKACTKFNVTNDIAEINMYLVDGSLIDEEYFYTLDPQTTLVLQKPGEKLLSDADLLYETLKKVNIDYLTVADEASKFLSDNLKKKVAMLNSILNSDNSKTIFSRREDHPEWFEGSESNVVTKEAYMHRRCQDRIRGYLYKTIEQIKASETWKVNQKARLRLHCIIEYFKLQLKEDHFFGYYFDRSRSSKSKLNDGLDAADGAYDKCYDHCPCKLTRLGIEEETNDKITSEDEIDAKKVSSNKKLAIEKLEVKGKKKMPYEIFFRGEDDQFAFCDATGEFKCEGLWNAEHCAYGEKHKINPYRSREELILFSTWNLDHKIERSRTLVPQLIKSSERDLIKNSDVYEYYQNLFTNKNLNLVHIVCHDKGSHT